MLLVFNLNSYGFQIFFSESPWKLLFYLLVITRNNLPLKICCESVVYDRKLFFNMNFGISNAKFLVLSSKLWNSCL